MASQLIKKTNELKTYCFLFIQFPYTVHDISICFLNRTTKRTLGQKISSRYIVLVCIGHCSENVGHILTMETPF